MLNLLNSLAVSFDLPILDWIQANLQSGFMDFIMPIITVFGDANGEGSLCGENFADDAAAFLHAFVRSPARRRTDQRVGCVFKKCLCVILAPRAQDQTLCS